MRTANYKYITAVALAVFALSLAAIGQAPQKCPTHAGRLTAEKIDEFNYIDDSELYIDVAILFERLKDAPSGTYAYVIAYNGADALPADIGSNHVAMRIREAVASQKQNDTMFVMIDGGYRKTDGAEFFLVRPKTKPPLPSKTVPAPTTPKGTVLWAKNIFTDESGVIDEFVNRAVVYRDLEDDDFDGRPFIPELPTTQPNPSPTAPVTSGQPEIWKLGLFIPDLTITPNTSEKPPLTAKELDAIRFSWTNKKFAPAVAKSKNAHGVMIYYADVEYYDTSRLEPFIADGRDRIANAAGLDPVRIQVIFGGYRGQPQVEYWLVPANGDQPIPNPEDPNDDRPWDH